MGGEKLPVIPYVPEEKPEKPRFIDGEYLPSDGFSDGVWQVYLEKSAEQTQQLQEGLRYLLRSITPGVNFVQIDRYAAVLLWQEEGSTNQQIEKAARKVMTGVFRRHPDFGYVELSDGGIALMMNKEQAWLFLKPELVQRKEDGSIPMSTLLAARSVLMDACYSRKMFAIARSVPVEQ